jgi:hypothetical protein
MRSASALLVAASLILVTAATRAASAQEATRDAAREIAQEGLELYDGGKYKEALDRFVRADGLVHAPTMVLMAARSLARLGRLVEASERYAAASQMVLETGASQAFREAVTDAAREGDALLPRIPSVVLTVDAPAGASSLLTLDGVTVPAALLGQKRPTDPGSHSLEATSGGVRRTARVELKEGESRPIHFDLRATVVATSPAASPLRTTGWIVGALGLATGAFGAVTGGLGLAKKDELESKYGCSQQRCTNQDAAADVNQLNALRLMSTGGIVAGAVLLAGGVTLVLVAPKPVPPPAAARVQWSLGVGFGSVAMQGAF